MIDFTLSERDHTLLQAARARALICRRYARHYDEHEDEFAPEALPEAADWQDPPLPPVDPERDTGAALGMLYAMEEYWGDYTVRLRRSRGGLGNAALAASGTPEQIARWRDLTLAMAITEPGAGSDSKAIQMTAELDPASDEWILRGEKIFVTTGCRADGVVVWATLDRSAGRGGIKSFLVEKGRPGFEVSHREKKLGIRADDTAALVFRDCRVPRDHLLGGNESVEREGSGGFRGVMRTFNWTRPGVAAIGLGIARAALDFTREELAREGIEFDYTTAPRARSALAQELLEIEADIEAAVLTTLHAAWLGGSGRPNNTEASIAKAKGGEVARRATQRCLALLGSLSLSREHLVEKWFRDARITDIYEGTGQIQRLIIARDILEYSAAELS
jgi:acyl-CoA dehydrogenase